MNEIYRAMAECAAEAARIAEKARGADLDAPTTCADFDLRALLNHWILYTSHGLELRASKTPLPPELLERDFTAEEDWPAAYAAQLDRALRAWSEPSAWEGDIPLGEGHTSPAPQVATMIVKELALHGWDVARSLGEEISLGEGSALLVLRTVEEHAELFRRYGGFADPVPVPDSATPFERALALSGRDPRLTL